jgi:hypothetical protein
MRFIKVMSNGVVFYNVERIIAIKPIEDKEALVDRYQLVYEFDFHRYREATYDHCVSIVDTFGDVKRLLSTN